MCRQGSAGVFPGQVSWRRSGEDPISTGLPHRESRLIGAAAVGVPPPVRRSQLYQRLAGVSSNPERRAHYAALAAGPGPDPAVADALDAAASAAHRRAANATAGQFASRAVAFTPAGDADALGRRRSRAP